MKSKIDSFYVKHNCERLTQGDILRDFSFLSIDDSSEYTFQYIVIISQDCDISYSREQKEDKNTQKILYNQYLPNILFTPAFILSDFKEGIHLKKLYNVEQKTFNITDLGKIKDNSKEIRYHYLPYYEDFQVQDLIIDFKIYFTLSLDKILKVYQDKYVATISELFRESLSQRFANYISRIGLPIFGEEINNDNTPT